MPKNLILSPSGINLYLNCPYSFMLRYIEKLQPVITDDSALRLGKSVHAILENFYKNINLSTNNPSADFQEALKKTALIHWDRSLDAKKTSEMNNHLFLWLQFEIQRFNKYKEKNILDKFYPITTEEDIIDYEKRLRAIIDKRCVGQNGNIYCMDYKTDKNLPAQRNFKGNLAEIDDKYKIQSALNAIVLQTKGIKLDNFYFQFIRYPDKLLSIPLIPELFTEVEATIKKIRETTEFVKNPKGCFFCGMKVHCIAKNTSMQCMTSDSL